MLEPVTADNLSSLPGVAHGFFTRRGGVSQGIYDALNCGLGSQDDAAAVQENRARVARHLGAAVVLTAHQVHSAVAVAVRTPWQHDRRPRCDAIVTATPGIAVGVLSADCAPILFADPVARVVGAAHAGWRGAVGGIAEATIAEMEALGARRERIAAAVGPSIGPRVYQVGADFQAAVVAQDAAATPYFHEPSPGARPHFDLPGYVVGRLERAGVAVLRNVPPCTYDVHQLFFSFRRSQSEKEPDYGRQISAIVLT